MYNNSKRITDIEECFCQGILPVIESNYLIKINHEKFMVEKHQLNGKEILNLIGQSPDDYFLILKSKRGKRFVEKDELVDFTKEGIEKFIAQPHNCKIVDFEEWFKKGVVPVITYRYVLKINNDKFTVDTEEMTGRELLKLIGQTPETYFLRQKTKDGKKLIESDEVVDFTKCGIERFIAQPKDCREGLVLQKCFTLPEEDIKFLEGLGLVCETIVENNLKWLIIRDYPISGDYIPKTADLALMIQPNYPVVQIDMFYLSPGVQRVDLKKIGALCPQTIEGKQYQRWSRHRAHSNQWIPGEDNVSTHLDLINSCLQEEFKKR